MKLRMFTKIAPGAVITISRNISTFTGILEIQLCRPPKNAELFEAKWFWSYFVVQLDWLAYLWTFI